MSSGPPLRAFALFMAALYPLRRVNDATSKVAVASGAFMLMRREDLRALGGFEHAREAVLDDRRIVEVFKHNGGRIHVAPSENLVRTTFHERARLVSTRATIFETLRDEVEPQGRKAS
ncbi:MAG: hypothetical protein JW940_01505 [Polyangiaceae bacterium]|nr:hypothetical protein [Polyangiaceae bacterium]